MLFHPKTIADPEWPIVVTVLPPLASRLGSLGRAVPPGRQCPPNCNVTKRNFLRLRNLHSCEACTRLSSCLTLGCLALACLPNTSSTTFRSRSSRLVASPAAKEIATLSIFVFVFRLLGTLDAQNVNALMRERMSRFFRHARDVHTLERFVQNIFEEGYF